MNLLTQIGKTVYNTLIIILQILWILFLMIIRGKKLPGFLETLDDKFTHNLKPWQRERIIKGFNRILAFRPVWWLVCLVLRSVAKGKVIDLDTKEFRRARKKSSRVGIHHERIKRYKWKNWIGSQKVEPLNFHILGNVHPLDVEDLPPPFPLYDYKTLEELYKIVVTDNRENKKVRAVGSGHALSDVAMTRDIMISTAGLTCPQRMADKSLLKDSLEKKYQFTAPVDLETPNRNSNNRYLFEIGAGLKIYALNHYLEQLGLSLINQGGTDVQAFMGAVSTSTHGSGIGLTAMPDMVKSMVAIAGDGNKYRIEPENGITDPEKFEASEDSLHEIKLIQDDDVFNSWLVSMGCMGVVYSVIIEVTDAYSLGEERKVTTWERIRSELLVDPKAMISKKRHFEISINPYASEKKEFLEEHVCLVTTRDPIDPVSLQKKRRKGEYYSRNFIADVMSGLHLTGPLSVWLFNNRPTCIPKLIDNSLKRLQDNTLDGGGFHGKSFEVLNQGLEKLRDTGYAIEICFPMETFVQAIDRMLKIAKEMVEQYEIYNPAPFALRFVDKSDAYMSMMHDRVSCTVEVVTLKGINGADVLLRRIEEEMFQFGGRPHWGLNIGCISTQKDRIQDAYPKFDKWLEVYERFNPNEIFDNGFTDNCKFRAIITTKKKLASMRKSLKNLEDDLPTKILPGTPPDEISKAIKEIERELDTW